MKTFLSVCVLVIFAGCATHNQRQVKARTYNSIFSIPIHIDSFVPVNVINTNTGQTAKRLIFTVSGCEIGTTNLMLASNIVTDPASGWLPIIAFVQQSEPTTFTRTIALAMLQNNTYFRVHGSPSVVAIAGEDDLDPGLTIYTPIIMPANTNKVISTNTPPAPSSFRKVKR